MPPRKFWNLGPQDPFTRYDSCLQPSNATSIRQDFRTSKCSQFLLDIHNVLYERCKSNLHDTICCEVTTHASCARQLHAKIIPSKLAFKVHFQNSATKIRVFEQNTDIIKFWLFWGNFQRKVGGKFMFSKFCQLLGSYWEPWISMQNQKKWFTRINKMIT